MSYLDWKLNPVAKSVTKAYESTKFKVGFQMFNALAEALRQ